MGTGGPTVRGGSMTAPVDEYAARPPVAVRLLSTAVRQLTERHGDLSHRSIRSIASAFSIRSVASVGSILSIGSSGSILSIGSTGSILSIGSAGSILSIGSAGSILSIGSAGSITSVGEAGSLGRLGDVLEERARRDLDADDDPRADGQPEVGERHLRAI